MRVVCDQCATTYKVPNARLTKPVNKGVCRTCGARLLIPKPAAGADDDERVVVTAIPATSTISDANVVAPGAEDDEDKTIPVIDRTRANGPVVVDDPLVVAGAQIGRAEREVLSRFAPAAPAPVVTARGRATPPPPPAAPRAPAPPPAAPAASADVALAVIGFGAAVLGLLVLAFAETSLPLVFAGLFLAATGALTALSSIAFSEVGRKPGRPGLAIGLGTGAGLIVAILATALMALVNPSNTPSAPVAATPDGNPATPAAAAPVADAAKADAVKADAAKVEAPTKPDAVRPEPVRAPEPTRTPEPTRAPEPVRAAAAPAPTPAPTPAPARAPEPVRAAPAPAPAPAPTPAPAPAPAPAAAAPMPTVPPSVIHTIISNNVGVKRCFYDALRTQEIVKPVKVNTTFFLSAQGRASNLRVTSPSENSSGNLARCLDSAFQTMTFPASAEGKQVNYPFSL